MALWTSFAKERLHDVVYHRVQARKCFEERTKGEIIPGIPGRVMVFGISVLPFYHIDILKSLLRDHEVSLFILQPSPCVSGISINAQSSPKTLQGNPSGGNSLLRSMGTAGRHCFDRIMHYANGTYPDFGDFGGDSLLAQIKNDIKENHECDHGKAITGKH